MGIMKSYVRSSGTLLILKIMIHLHIRRTVLGWMGEKKEEKIEKEIVSQHETQLHCYTQHINHNSKSIIIIIKVKKLN